MMYNDFKPHLVKKGETVAGIAKQYGVLEDDLITTNPNISLTQSPGNWFRSFKWVASVKEGDTLRIPFYNEDQAKKGVKAISGKTSVKPGEWEEYSVTEWYGGTPLEDRNEDRVKWELYLLQPGKAPEKVLEKETGHFRFMEKAVGERFKVVAYMYKPELNNNTRLNPLRRIPDTGKLGSVITIKSLPSRLHLFKVILV